MNKAELFENETELKPLEACKFLGISYSLWKELKNGSKPIQPYHLASLEAHQALTKPQFNRLKKKRLNK